MNKRINYFLSIIFLLIFTSNSLAKCDFGLNLGDKIPDSFVERSGNLLEDERVHLVYFEADELCGNPTLKDIGVEFAFLDGETMHHLFLNNSLKPAFGPLSSVPAIG